MTHRFKALGALATSAAVLVMVSTPADARRRGSFGSRGARTYEAPATTNTAPKQVAPVQRSMTERPSATTAQRAGQPQGQSRAQTSSRGGMAKGLIGGLLAAGLIGALLGNGFGGFGAGLLMALLQVALIGGLVWLGFRLFRRRPALAGGPGAAGQTPFMMPDRSPAPPPARTFSYAAPPAHAGEDIRISNEDKEAFERLLMDVQDAFAKEDFARLRELTTPEVMSYFAEELSQNATKGVRNDVAGTELIEAEVAEAWREGRVDYATIAMRYESIDVMLDRSTGAVVEGDPNQASETTELWTFQRKDNGPWRLSAVQET